MENLKELFEDTIKDLYNAEKQFLKAMPKLMRAATNPELKDAIETHIVQTETQIERLEQVADTCGFKPSGKVCKAAQGLVEEAAEHLDEGSKGPTLDAAIIACAQKNEHYEICSYGTVIAWAELLGQKECMNMLKESLREEVAADELLSNVAQSVNAASLNEGSEGESGSGRELAGKGSSSGPSK